MKMIFESAIKDFFTSLRALPKAKQIIGLGMVLILAVLLYHSLLATQILKMNAFARQLKAKKNIYFHYAELVKNTNKIEEEARAIESRLTRMASSFVKQENLSGYFSSFREAVKSHNLQIITLDFKPQEAVSISPEEKLSYFEKLPFYFSVRGNYFDAMLLLYKLQSGNPILDVRSIRLRQESADKRNIEMEVEASVFVLVKKK